MKHNDHKGAGMKLEDAIPSNFFSAQICSLAHQRVSVINAGAMEKAGLSITFFAKAEP